MSTAISTDIARFLDEQIDSLEHLEIFLVLAREPGSSKTVEELALKVGLPAAKVPARLRELCDRGLIERSTEGYRYVATPPLAGLVTGLMQAYREQRLEVLHRVSERALKRLRNFADAFRLRREGTHD